MCYEIFGEKPNLQVHNKFDDKDNYYVPNTDKLKLTLPDITFTQLATSVRKMLIHAKSQIAYVFSLKTKFIYVLLRK